PDPVEDFRPTYRAALRLGSAADWLRIHESITDQNRKRSVPCNDLGPPVWSSGASPLPGLPLPSIRFSIEVDWPKTALLRYFTGSAKLAWLKMLKASMRN